jgi:hypothetical protein
MLDGKYIEGFHSLLPPGCGDLVVQPVFRTGTKRERTKSCANLFVEEECVPATSLLDTSFRR